jgi:SAM-dependent methyltransferase
MSPTTASGSAARHGELWGARAQDWAANEDQQTPTYEEAIRRVGIGPGQLVLDIGCGSGVFVRAVADRGARAHGVDASKALIEIARTRTPDADLRVGEMQDLPYDDDMFDVVTGFNSFFFADDIVAALREAGRVAKAGAPVVIQVWGPPERCDLTAMRGALAAFLPPPDPNTPAPPPLWRPGVLEELAEQAGLTPSDAFDVSWAGLRLPGRGRARARDALPRPRGPGHSGRRGGAGAHRLSNEWHFAIARA